MEERQTDAGFGEVWSLSLSLSPHVSEMFLVLSQSAGGSMETTDECIEKEGWTSQGMVVGLPQVTMTAAMTAMTAPLSAMAAVTRHSKPCSLLVECDEHQTPPPDKWK